jgi:ATP-dependent protease HslVU (ClpYQ) peptidase subunit
VTCIIGMAHDGHVYMGGDSMTVSGLDRFITSRQKVFRVGEFLIGTSGSIRMAQILRYHLAVRTQEEGEDDMHYLVVAFVEAFRDCLKQYGHAKVNSSQEDIDGVFLVGYRGKLYRVAQDMQIDTYQSQLAAIGCGGDYALGAVRAMSDEIEPVQRLCRALEISAEFSAGVAAPFYVEVL